jgi:2-oxoacid:acceptor oxidoreductase gamma subunit (pyruvate/2-ketoisovalerate family)
VLEIRFSGRGGQGVVVASQILGTAFFKGGRYPQCYSVFAGERRGAPVVSFLRVGTEEILLKCEILVADELICFDETVVDAAQIRGLLHPGGRILMNSRRPRATWPGLEGFDIGYVDANAVAEEVGLSGVINTAMLGAYWGFSGSSDLAPLLDAVKEMVPAKEKANLEAVRLAHARFIDGRK